MWEKNCINDSIARLQEEKEQDYKLETIPNYSIHNRLSVTIEI